ncbi:MAG: thymidine kinase [Deltaproteobacteria bacterium]|nr:thymidine kinase [Deltaproteobacteria bacterium]
MTRTGAIEVICGPMFSGKTEELIRRVRRAQIARQRVLVFKPCIDDRYDVNDVVSHSSQRIPSQPVENVAEMRDHLEKSDFPDVVGIDEVQFFDEDVTDFIEYLAEQGVRVVVGGLDLDYLGVPFGPIPRLLALAETVIKQSAVCMVCGDAATRSQRVSKQQLGLPGMAQEPNIDDQVLVGAEDAYEARCRRCWVRGIDVPSASIHEFL